HRAACRRAGGDARLRLASNVTLDPADEADVFATLAAHQHAAGDLLDLDGVATVRAEIEHGASLLIGSEGRINEVGFARKGCAMQLTQAERELDERFLKAMLEATFPLQVGLDQEVTLQALIRAADMLKQRFEQELDELRQESD